MARRLQTAERLWRRDTSAMEVVLMVVMCFGDIALVYASVDYLLPYAKGADWYYKYISWLVTASIAAATILVPSLFGKLLKDSNSKTKITAGILYAVFFSFLVLTLCWVRVVGVPGGNNPNSPNESTYTIMMAVMMSVLMVLTSLTSFIITWRKASPEYLSSVYESELKELNAEVGLLETLGFIGSKEESVPKMIESLNYDSARAETEGRLELFKAGIIAKMMENFADPASTSAGISHSRNSEKQGFLIDLGKENERKEGKGGC